VRKFGYLFVMTAYVLALSGCAENQTKVGEGAALGGILGAVAGGVVGHQQKGRNDVGGALLGGAIGAAAGGIVGSQMPNQNAPQRVSVAQPAYPISQITMQQVVDWTRQGLSSDEIISRIRTTNSMYSLTADDINYLRRQGVSERVVETMQAR
jgi:phage tail tape-measure protein